MEVVKKPPIMLENLNLSVLEELEDKEVFISNIQECTIKSSSMREQIYKISNMVINGKSLSLQTIANIFHKKKGTIATHIERAKREIAHGGVNPIGRPPILDSYIMSSLRKKVCEDYENHILCTYSSLAEWLYEIYNITISSNTLGSIIRKDQMVKPIWGKPMEIERLDAS